MTQSAVLVGTDLSDASLHAIRQGAAWAERHGVPLIVGHVQSGLGFSTADAETVRAAIEKLVSELSSTPAEIVLSTGSPHAALIQMAAERKASLLVVGASGAGALKQALFGSTAASVARYSTCSVLVARPSPSQGPVVVGTDFSDAVTAALELGGNDAIRRGTELILVHSMFEPSSPLNLLGPVVVSPPQPSNETVSARRDAAETTLKSLQAVHPGPSRSVVVDDDPAAALATEAEHAAASLIVVGTHGRTGFARVAMGSVAEAVAQHAPCSVLIARRSNGAHTGR